jgi:hypothetical protein
MRLNPDNLKVETFATDDIPEQVGHGSSNTGWAECSGACLAPTCQYHVCG